MLAWIGSYLDERTQTVRVRDELSYKISATSGVLQGSHLGSMFFILFINNLVSQLRHVKSVLYADDLKLFMLVSSVSQCCEI